jgi:hypothetical protein
MLLPPKQRFWPKDLLFPLLMSRVSAKLPVMSTFLFLTYDLFDHNHGGYIAHNNHEIGLDIDLIAGATLQLRKFNVHLYCTN